MKNNTYDLIIVGAGASGMMAALTAAEKKLSVLLLERNSVIGKKILSTGNGRCNYTNEKMDISFYHADLPAFVETVLKTFSYESTLQFFSELGIYPQKLHDGYFYPHSMQAAAVSDALKMKLDAGHVLTHVSTQVRRIEKQGALFCVKTEEKTFYGKTCLIATGGKAAPVSGSTGDGYFFAKSFGHTVVEPLPALVPLLSRENDVSSLAGIRLSGKASLFVEGREVQWDYGEIQYTKDGLSGIPVFQLSANAAKSLFQKKKTEISIHLLPECTDQEIHAILVRRFGDSGWYKNAGEALIGLFPQKMIPVLLKRAKIAIQKPANEMTDADFLHLSQIIKQFTFSIYATKGFPAAQVTCGGIALSEILPQTMESRFASGLFFAGEVMNCDGLCGGYNLQWAWATGFIAGCAAAAKVKDKEND